MNFPPQSYSGILFKTKDLANEIASVGVSALFPLALNTFTHYAIFVEFTGVMNDDIRLQTMTPKERGQKAANVANVSWSV